MESALRRAIENETNKEACVDTVVLPNVSYPYSCKIVAGGFFNGTATFWNSSIPFIPLGVLDTNRFIHVIKLSDHINIGYRDRVLYSALERLADAGYRNVDSANPATITVCQDLYEQQYAVIQATFLPHTFNCYSTTLRSSVWLTENKKLYYDESTQRTIEYVSGKSAELLFQEYEAVNSIAHNALIDVESVLFGSHVGEEVLFQKNGGFPNIESAFLGCDWNKPLYAVTTNENLPIFLVSSSEQNTSNQYEHDGMKYRFCPSDIGFAVNEEIVVRNGDVSVCENKFGATDSLFGSSFICSRIKKENCYGSLLYINAVLKKVSGSLFRTLQPLFYVKIN